MRRDPNYLWRMTLAVALAWLLNAFAATARAGDHPTRPKKEPAYRKSPRYAVLAFGPSSMPHWLVLDGDLLYVDRNGDGNLTEPGKRVATSAQGKYGLEFQAGDIQDGVLRHTALTVAVGELAHVAADYGQTPEYKRLLAADPQALSYRLRLEVAMPGRIGTGRDGRIIQCAGPFDTSGILQFAPRTESAPVLCFGGPWRLSSLGPQTIPLPSAAELFFTFGTPGKGPGTFVSVGYEKLMPEAACLVADIVLPPKLPGQPPLPARVRLTDRC